MSRNFFQDYLNRLAYSYLKACPKILDVGCGSGEFVKLNRRKIIGMDSNRVTVNQCRRDKLKAVFGQATKLPFASGSFSGLNCSHVIEHLYPSEVYRFLAEAGRVLKPGGILIISSPLFWPGFYNNLSHIKPYPPAALLRYLTEAAPDTTFSWLKYRFKKLALIWRFRPFLSYRLYPLGIYSPFKDGYMLVLKKIR